MAMARVSEAFLILRATGLGLEPAFAPFVLIGMSVVYGLGAYPAGALADRMPARALVFAAILALAGAEAVLAFAHSVPHVALGVALWGLHMALSQGLLAKLVADHSPPTLRGTAFGFFNIASAIAIVIGNSMFGLVWSQSGAAVAYAAAAGLAAVVACIALLALPQRQPATR